MGKFRRLHAREKHSEREIARNTGLSRNTVPKCLHAPVSETPIFSVPTMVQLADCTDTT
jgi:DNA invertase Pin-like site-specific DNA recombinase